MIPGTEVVKFFSLHIPAHVLYLLTKKEEMPRQSSPPKGRCWEETLLAHIKGELILAFAHTGARLSSRVACVVWRHWSTIFEAGQAGVALRQRTHTKSGTAGGQHHSHRLTAGCSCISHTPFSRCHTLNCMPHTQPREEEEVVQEHVWGQRAANCRRSDAHCPGSACQHAHCQ